MPVTTRRQPACPASAAELGFKPLPEKPQTGEMLAAYGIFASK
jgi:uncharacterized protein (DUF169 family)